MRRCEWWKRKVEKYSRENYPANVLTYRSIDRSFAISSRLCKNWWVFHKAERIRFKTVLFLSPPLLRIRHLHSALYPPDSFQIHSIRERDESRDTTSEYLPFILTILTIFHRYGISLLEDIKEGLCGIKIFQRWKMFLVIEILRRNYLLIFK